jgi:hypothetical protein
MLLVWWTVQRTDKQMRMDLLEQAALVAQSVDLGRLQALTGPAACSKM